MYKDKQLDVDFRCDIFVENCLVVELKHVIAISNVHERELINYETTKEFTERARF
ncbi:MAG: GxxExxY protein [Bacteroidetes bacterium]|nr:GxxExxY protein [Bacteroidota bacterium]